MSKESRKYRQVDLYLSRIGISKIDNLDLALEREVGPEKAIVFLKEFERLSDNRDNQEMETYSSDSTELHDLLTRNKSINRIVESFYDADILRECCMWVMEHKDSIGETVLDVGCGSGVITCFAAGLRPDVSFVGIDRSSASIDRAKELAKELELNNVEFHSEGLSGIDGKQYPTVFSFRTIHENIGFKASETRYLSFDEQVSCYKRLYSSYVSDISSFIEDAGNVISVERFCMDTDFYGLLCEYSDNGLGFGGDARSMSCKEADFDDPTDLVAFCLAKSTECDAQTLFEKWSELAFNPDEESEDYTEPQADYILQEYDDGLISGYETFNECGTKCAKCGLYKVKGLPDAFIMYQANKEKKSLIVYPMDRLEEAKGVFDRCMKQDEASGFRVEKI